MTAFVTLAGVGLLACLLITQLPLAAAASRSAARVAGAIIGSVAGVFGFQLLLTLPAEVLLFGVLWCAQHLTGRLDGVAQIAWNMMVIFSMFGVFVFGTLLGFVVGWGVGARTAAGTSVARALAGSRVLNALSNRISVVRSWVAV